MIITPVYRVFFVKTNCNSQSLETIDASFSRFKFTIIALIVKWKTPFVYDWYFKVIIHYSLRRWGFHYSVFQVYQDFIILYNSCSILEIVVEFCRHAAIDLCRKREYRPGTNSFLGGCRWLHQIRQVSSNQYPIENSRRIWEARKESNSIETTQMTVFLGWTPLSPCPV